MPHQINTPMIVTGTTFGGNDQPKVTVKAMHDAKAGRYINISVAVEHPLIPVTVTRISRMRLGATGVNIIRQELMSANPELVKIPAIKSYFSGSKGRPVAMKMRLKPSPDHLDTAAVVFRLARLAGDYPIKAVQHSFGLEYNEAKAWVSELRRTGAL